MTVVFTDDFILDVPAVLPLKYFCISFTRILLLYFKYDALNTDILDKNGVLFHY